MTEAFCHIDADDGTTAGYSWPAIDADDGTTAGYSWPAHS